ncbi:hypothetical protein SISSUDRAFT_1033127 [Sistotremastrum suecicum HHB10207 ss-3]|uniref:Uncharacterized protein n=1 Tax=Sistotremastrum suecicum HHB10207 ss-3 TaxID=1314776 RepID=A0A166DPG0_9AGAM|nr:hypothetical protein SISSUDRAFT_1033127 [Sistotremastrum suecicum HHB10207 ss-3]
MARSKMRDTEHRTHIGRFYQRDEGSDNSRWHCSSGGRELSMGIAKWSNSLEEGELEYNWSTFVETTRVQVSSANADSDCREKGAIAFSPQWFHLTTWSTRADSVGPHIPRTPSIDTGSTSTSNLVTVTADRKAIISRNFEASQPVLTISNKPKGPDISPAQSSEFDVKRKRPRTRSGPSLLPRSKEFDSSDVGGNNLLVEVIQTLEREEAEFEWNRVE